MTLLRASTHFVAIFTGLQNYESTNVISSRSKALGASNFKWFDNSGYPQGRKCILLDNYLRYL
jgi:hypothetical protein